MVKVFSPPPKRRTSGGPLHDQPPLSGLAVDDDAAVLEPRRPIAAHGPLVLGVGVDDAALDPGGREHDVLDEAAHDRPSHAPAAELSLAHCEVEASGDLRG